MRQMSRMCSARCASEIHVFCPLIVKPPFSRTALHLSEPTSEPASGSDIAIASTLPFAMPVRMSRFCSSVPNRS